MPLLFALGQHRALVPVHSRLFSVHTALDEELFRHCHIRVHAGKTRVWNAAGIRPDACDLLERLAARHNSGPVWRGSEVPTHQQGVKILGTSPTSHLTRLQPHLFRTILLRRLRQPLPLSERSCRCGRPLDSSGHHRAACAQAGALGRRGFAVESAAARICREAGGRVRVNVFVRDMDLIIPNANDGRRLEVVVDGLPLFGGRNWPSTQPLSEPSMLMGQHAWERQTGMEWHSWRRDGARKRPILS